MVTSFSDAVSGSAVTITLTQPEGHTLVFESLNCTSDSATAYVSVAYNGTVVFKNTVGTTPINWNKFTIAPPNPPTSNTTVTVVLTATTAATLNVTYRIVPCA